MTIFNPVTISLAAGLTTGGLTMKYLNNHQSNLSFQTTELNGEKIKIKDKQELKNLEKDLNYLNWRAHQLDNYVENNKNNTNNNNTTNNNSNDNNSNSNNSSRRSSVGSDTEDDSKKRINSLEEWLVFY